MGRSPSIRPTTGLIIFCAGLFLALAAEAAKVKVGDDPTLGSPEAELVLLEFADYQ